jgi:hypothetical protein
MLPRQRGVFGQSIGRRADSHGTLALLQLAGSGNYLTGPTSQPKKGWLVSAMYAVRQSFLEAAESEESNAERAEAKRFSVRSHSRCLAGLLG